MKETLKIELTCPRCGKHLWTQFDAEDGELMFRCECCGEECHPEQMCHMAVPAASTIQVETPMGTLIAKDAYGGAEYPGIEVALMMEDGFERSLALIEHIRGGCLADTKGDMYPDERLYRGKAFPDAEETSLANAGMMARIWRIDPEDDPLTVAYTNTLTDLSSSLTE